jgi:hypothetical protein
MHQITEEEVRMYNEVPKEKLIRLLIESNRIVEIQCKKILENYEDVLKGACYNCGHQERVSPTKC